MDDASRPSPKLTAARILVVAVVSLVALPVVVVGLILLELLLFGSRHFSNGLEAIGLTKVLQAVFDALGMNG